MNKYIPELRDPPQLFHIGMTRGTCDGPPRRNKGIQFEKQCKQRWNAHQTPFPDTVMGNELQEIDHTQSKMSLELFQLLPTTSESFRDSC